jgi:hypothetical protein
MADQQSYQLKLPQAEIDRLGRRVYQDYRNALSDHDARIKRWTEYFRRWRARVDMPALGEQEKSNFPVPVIRWHVAAKWAKNMDALFGDDAEIVAVPVGPSDYRNDAKIGAYMTWRVFNDMKLTTPFCQFELYKILYGRAVAYAPWCVKTFDVPTSDGVKQVPYYKGPDFQVLEPDDFVVPAEQVQCLHDFSWVIRKYRVTPNDLLLGEDDGRYTGIRKNWDLILKGAYRRQQRDYEGDEIKLEKDDAEGVTMQSGLSIGNTLLVLEWYGKWRMLKRGVKDADEWDTQKRDMYERDIVVRFIPDLQLVVGVQDLAQLYPATPKRRPFVEASFQKDGSYWCDGLAAQLIDIEDEVRSNHNLGTDAQELAIAPLIFYRPGSGYNPDTFVLKPGQEVPVDNPNQDVRVVEFPFNGEAVQLKEQSVLAYAERLTGLSDMALGRQSDRPNAPKTARGTVAILEEGNVRMTLDTTTMREDMAAVLQHFWMLEWMFADEETFFRVTEEDANGLFPVREGGSILTQAERNGRYDFRLEFATSKWSREAEKERTLARYQLDLQNPLIVQNPLALWRVTKDAHAALGDPNFADLVPEPPHPDLPHNPKEEWAMIQQGEDVHVNPMDNDELHMIRHMRDLETAQRDNYGDQEAITRLKAHYIDHIHQLEQKKLVQALAERMVQRAAELQHQVSGQLPPGVLMPPGTGSIPATPMPLQGSIPSPISPAPFKSPGASAPAAGETPAQ